MPPADPAPRRGHSVQTPAPLKDVRTRPRLDNFVRILKSVAYASSFLLVGVGVFLALEHWIGPTLKARGIREYAAEYEAGQRVHVYVTNAPILTEEVVDPSCPKGMAFIKVNPEAVAGTVVDAGTNSSYAPAESYCIDIAEVTMGAYSRCEDEHECTPARCPLLADPKADLPMVCVTYEQASAYCLSQGKRMPSYQEWRYAASGNDSRRYPWGSDRPSAIYFNGCAQECDSSNSDILGDDGHQALAPIRSFPAGRTPEGVFDLSGNVAEWTSSFGSPPLEDQRVIAGGNYLCSAAYCAAVSSFSYASDMRTSTSRGFRCARGGGG